MSGQIPADSAHFELGYLLQFSPYFQLEQGFGAKRFASKGFAPGALAACRWFGFQS
jgi:hypothetical protein